MVEIRQQKPGRDLAAFLRFPHDLYRDDPAWVAPLHRMVIDQLTPGTNPFFDHAEVALFTAWQGSRIVGRISAQVDQEHLEAHDDGAGFFGFLDTVNDQAVATALLDRAARWLADRGMTTMRGPFSLSINEEAGTLVEGFERPPVMMMPHHRPYQGRLIEGAGLRKVRDLHAWWYRAAAPTPRSGRALQQMLALPELRFRSVRPRRMNRDITAALLIFNEAWRDNWGFVPATPAEARKLAHDLRLILDPELAFFADIDGRPAAVVICLPNLNEVIRDFGGRLTPVNLLKLLWRLRVRKPKTARVMMLGVLPEIRRQKRYRPLSTALYAELTRRGVAAGYEWAELSWTLEENRAINLGIQAMGGIAYKRYRLYERALIAASS